MPVSHQLSEIRQTMEDALDPKDRLEHEQSGTSRWNVYEKTLKTVEETAGRSAMRDLSVWVQTQIRNQQELPSGTEVREEGGRICREMGYEIEPESWLRP